MQGRTDSGLAGWWAGDNYSRRKGHIFPLASVLRGLKMIAGMTLVMLFADFTKLSSQKVLSSTLTSNAADCLAYHVRLHNLFTFYTTVLDSQEEEV